MNNPLKKSAGVALITVLLVVAAATIAAVSISSRLQVDIRRTENLMRSDQAWLHALGVESWAKGQLIADLKEDQEAGEELDYLQDEEVWTVPIESSVEGGAVKGEIIDQQGLFNLNNLLTEPSEDEPVVPSINDIKYFKRLLSNLDLEGLPVDDLVNALIDWLDEDSTVTGTGGAEDDDYYQTQEPAYNAANRLMAHQSELLLVRWITPEIYQKLAPVVTALPERTTININTAERKVLQSVYSGLTDGNVDDLIGDIPHKSVPDFNNHHAASGLNVMKNSREAVGLDVKSNYFRVKSKVNVGRARLAITSLLKRTDTGEVKVLHRLREDIF